MSIRPFVFLLIPFAAVAALLLLSVVRLDEAHKLGADGDIQKWTLSLVASSGGLLILVVALVGRQLPAFLFAATVARSRAKTAVVVTNGGSVALNGGASVRKGCFFRCLVASEDGLQLWTPFRESSRLAWGDLEVLVAQSRIEDAAHTVVIRVVRTHPTAKLFFVPHSRSFAGSSAVGMADVEMWVKALLEKRPSSLGAQH